MIPSKDNIPKIKQNAYYPHTKNPGHRAPPMAGRILKTEKQNPTTPGTQNYSTGTPRL